MWIVYLVASVREGQGHILYLRATGTCQVLSVTRNNWHHSTPRLLARLPVLGFHHATLQSRLAASVRRPRFCISHPALWRPHLASCQYLAGTWTPFAANPRMSDWPMPAVVSDSCVIPIPCWSRWGYRRKSRKRKRRKEPLKQYTPLRRAGPISASVSL